MSESTILTLDIGGGSEGAVAAVNQVADSFNALNEATGQTGAGLSAVGGAAAESKGASEALGSSFQSLSSAGGQLAGTLGQVSPGLGGVAHAGTDLVGTLGKVASEAGAAGIPLASLAEVAAVVAAGFVELGKSGAEYIAQIAKLSEVTGMGVDDVVTWTKAIEDAGGSTDTFSRSALVLERSLTDAQDQFLQSGTETKTYKLLVNDLGISLTDGAGHAKNFAQAFPEVMTALAGVSDVTQRNVDIQTIFGRTGRDLIPVFKDYADHLAAGAAAAKELGLTQQEVDGIHKNYAHDMQTLSTEFEKIATSVAPAFITVLKAVGDVIQFGVDHARLFWDVLKIANEAVLGPIGVLVMFIDKVVGMGTAFDAVGGVVSSFWSAFKSTAADAINAVISFINGLIDAWNSLPVIGSIAGVGNIDPVGGAHPSGSSQLADGSWIDQAGNIYSHAEGGFFETPHLAVIGDAPGGEWVLNKQQMASVLQGAGGGGSGGGGGGSSNISVVFNIAPGFGDNVHDLMAQIDEHLREVLRDSTALRGYI